MLELMIRAIGEEQRMRVLELVEEGGLCPEELLAPGSRYWGAYCGDALIGAIGCEYQGSYALLRSAVVDARHRGKGIAARLTETLLDDARRRGIEAIYLFSTESAPYWLKNGFAETTVREVEERLGSAPQVRAFDRLGWLPTERVYKRNLSR